MVKKNSMGFMLGAAPVGRGGVKRNARTGQYHLESKNDLPTAPAKKTAPAPQVVADKQPVGDRMTIAEARARALQQLDASFKRLA